MRMQELLDLYLTFFRVGAMTFGGGYAMLPILQREVVEKKHWATDEELTDYYAIGQCTPGVIAVNTATFIGQKYRGIPGGILTTLGVVSPSLIIISLIAALISSLSQIAWVQDALTGIRACVCVFILNAVTKLIRSAVKDRAALILYAVLFAGTVFFNLSPVLVVLTAGILGVILTNLGVRGK